MTDRIAMSEGRYSWEPAVLNAFNATPESVESKIEAANRAIAERLNDQNPPDFCETSALMYALDALDTLGALRLLVDPSPEPDATGGLPGPEITGD